MLHVVCLGERISIAAKKAAKNNNFYIAIPDEKIMSSWHCTMSQVQRNNDKKSIQVYNKQVLCTHKSYIYIYNIQTVKTTKEKEKKKHKAYGQIGRYYEKTARLSVL